MYANAFARQFACIHTHSQLFILQVYIYTKIGLSRILLHQLLFFFSLMAKGVANAKLPLRALYDLLMEFFLTLYIFHFFFTRGYYSFRSLNC